VSENYFDSGSPCVFHTPEGGELTFTLNNLYTHFNKSRFAIELLSSSSYQTNEFDLVLSNNTFSVSTYGDTSYL